MGWLLENRERAEEDGLTVQDPHGSPVLRNPEDPDLDLDKPYALADHPPEYPAGNGHQN